MGRTGRRCRRKGKPEDQKPDDDGDWATPEGTQANPDSGGKDDACHPAANQRLDKRQDRQIHHRYADNHAGKTGATC